MWKSLGDFFFSNISQLLVFGSAYVHTKYIIQQATLSKRRSAAAQATDSDAKMVFQRMQIWSLGIALGLCSSVNINSITALREFKWMEIQAGLAYPRQQ